MLEFGPRGARRHGPVEIEALRGVAAQSFQTFELVCRFHAFGNGQTVITLPAPTDTDQPCPVSPPEVLPAEVRVVKANAKHLDKCGRASDLLKVAKRAGVVYKVNGTVLRQGVWLKARTLKAVNARAARSYRVTVRAESADATYRLRGKQVWRMTFSTKPCAKAPEIAPHTGS